ncbi:hypothetical protein Tco_0085559 [Tanacetum coccineum]
MKKKESLHTLRQDGLNIMLSETVNVCLTLKETVLDQDSMHKPLPARLKDGKTLFQKSRRYTSIFDLSHLRVLVDIEKVFIMKMEILLEPTSNKLMVVTIKRPRDRANDDQEPSAGTDWGSKRRRSGKEPESTSAPREKTTTKAGKTTTDALKHLPIREIETSVQMNKQKKRSTFEADKGHARVLDMN